MTEPMPHIVLVHGLMGSLGYFDPAAHLPNAICHTPNLIGFGTNSSPISMDGITLKSQAESVAAFASANVPAPFWLLGHSVGGAVAMLLARLYPKRIAGLISVEGNFTLDDAFWCRHIAGLSSDAWDNEYQAMRSDAAGWLIKGGADVTPQRLPWASQILHNQPSSTVQAMAKAVVKETSNPEYLEAVREVVSQRTPLYLLAGERSHASWKVPDWVRAVAIADIIQPNTGHMMMLEEPTGFCSIVSQILSS